MRILAAVSSFAAAVVLVGCTTVPPKDYTEFRAHRPKSILVLPPLNNTTEVFAGYSVYTTTSIPIGELGYYVFPVVLVDRFLKENGLPTPSEMHQVPLAKLREVFGADAVLYITVDKYGSKYQVFSSNVYVSARAKLVDAQSGICIWENTVNFVQNGNSGLVDALVEQVANKLLDTAHVAAIRASAKLLTEPNQGLLKGPRHPEFIQ